MAKKHYVVRVVYGGNPDDDTTKGLLSVFLTAGTIADSRPLREDFLTATVFHVNPPYGCPDSYQWAVNTSAALVNAGYSAYVEKSPTEGKKTTKN